MIVPAEPNADTAATPTGPDDPPTTITVIVPTYDVDLDIGGSTASLGHTDIPDLEGVDYGGGAGLGLVDRLLHGPERTPQLATVRVELDRVQRELDELLKDIWDRTMGGVKLSQVQVSLSVTAQGSIGIASAGATASIALIFDRVTSSSTDSPTLTA